LPAAQEYLLGMVRWYKEDARVADQLTEALGCAKVRWARVPFTNGDSYYEVVPMDSFRRSRSEVMIPDFRHHFRHRKIGSCPPQFHTVNTTIWTQRHDAESSDSEEGSGEGGWAEVPLSALSECVTEMYTVTLVNISTVISHPSPQEHLSILC